MGKSIFELYPKESWEHIVNTDLWRGYVNYFGEEIKKDFEKAYSYYLMSAEQGDPYSMYSLGYMIVNKEKAFIERYEGISWLQKAAYEGYEDAIELLKKI